MEWHAQCETLCLNPLHPGPCKGSKRKSGGGGGSSGGRARKAAAPKAGGVEHEMKAKAAGELASALGLTDDPDGYAKGLASRLAAAKAQGDDKYREVFTQEAQQLTRGFMNKYAGHLPPAERRKLERRHAVDVADAINNGNMSKLRQIALDLEGGRSRQSAATGTNLTFAKAKSSQTRWQGMLAPIGKPTGDGRMFAPESLTNRDLPLPLRFQRSDGGGHAGAVVVGRILEIEYRDGEAYARGDWLDESITPEVREAKEWTRQGIVGPSVDLDDAVMELVPVDQETAATVAQDADDCGCDDAHAIKDIADQPMIKLVTQGRISGATLVQIPAFAECAALELSDEDGETLTAAVFAAGDPVAIAGEDDDPDDTGFYVSMSADKQWVTVVRDDGSVDRVHHLRIGQASADELAAWDAALTASAPPQRPPAAWFADPKLPGPTPLTVTEDGRVFGHLAAWGTCHVGKAGCVTAPRSHANYAFFHTGEVITDDGRSVEVGKITLGTGHAEPDANFRAAADHYDHTGSCVAVARAGEDAHGIWVAGSLTVEPDDQRVAALRRSPLSGDWRRIGNGLELVAALAVNVPGFPVLRSRVASGATQSLVASGVVAGANVRKKKPTDGNVDDEQMEDMAEKAVKKVNRRKKEYQSAVNIFDLIEQERADARVETAAALLEVIAVGGE